MGGNKIGQVAVTLDLKQDNLTCPKDTGPGTHPVFGLRRISYYSLKDLRRLDRRASDRAIHYGLAVAKGLSNNENSYEGA